jgi:peptide/nickel transport system permease protein
MTGGKNTTADTATSPAASEQSITPTQPPPTATAPSDAAVKTAYALPAPRLPQTRRRRPIVLFVGSTILFAWIVDAIAWTHIVPYRPSAFDVQTKFAGPSRAHLLGTDQFGRDTFSRMVAGARPVLEIAPAATGLAIVGGTILGLLAGSFGGWADATVMRILDAVLVFPAIIASILFVALLGRSTTVLITVIGLAFIPIVTRSVRAAALVQRDLPYVEAARLRGEPSWSLLVREVLPNVSRTVLVEATSRLGDAIFAAATLSFIGLGQPPGSPDWGASIADNRAWLQRAPWTVLAPALAIASLVIGVTLVTDELRSRLDRV